MKPLERTADLSATVLQGPVTESILASPLSLSPVILLPGNIHNWRMSVLCGQSTWSMSIYFPHELPDHPDWLPKPLEVCGLMHSCRNRHIRVQILILLYTNCVSLDKSLSPPSPIPHLQVEITKPQKEAFWTIHSEPCLAQWQSTSILGEMIQEDKSFYLMSSSSNTWMQFKT